MGERIQETIIFLLYGCIVSIAGFFVYILDMALFRIYLMFFSILSVILIFGFILIELTANKNQYRIYKVQAYVEHLQRTRNSKPDN